MRSRRTRVARDRTRVTANRNEHARHRLSVDVRICRAATDIVASLRAGRSGAVVSRVETTGFVCPGPKPTGLGQPFPLCTGAGAGENRVGVAVANDSEFSIESLESLSGSLTRLADASSPGRHWTVRTIGCEVGPRGCPCSDGRALLVLQGESDLGDPGTGVVLFELRMAGRDWSVPAVAIAASLGEDRVLRDGGDYAEPSPFISVRDFGKFFRWTP